MSENNRKECIGCREMFVPGHEDQTMCNVCLNTVAEYDGAVVGVTNVRAEYLWSFAIALKEQGFDDEHIIQLLKANEYAHACGGKGPSL